MVSHQPASPKPRSGEGGTHPTHLTHPTHPTYTTHPTHPTYFPENASGLNAGLILIVLNVHSSVVFPSTDRET
jgi:hypothetical protein